MQLMEITPTAANAKQYAQIVHDKALLRRLTETASDIIETVYTGGGTASDVLEAAEKRIFALRRGNTGESLEHIGTVLLKVFDRLTEMAESGSDISGLSTGLRDLDKFISGLNKTDLLILAARPGMGKTAMALNLALNVAKKNPKRTVAFFSLEMSKQQLVTRLIASESFVDNQKLTTGQLTVDEWSKIGIAASALAQTGGRQPLHHRGGDERQVPPHRRPGAGHHRLSTAHGLRRGQEQRRRKPPAGRFGHLPQPENHGQGAECAGYLPVAALPCE